MVEQKGEGAGLDNLFPDGYSDKFRSTSPFGFIAKAPKGVTAFYNNLFGSGYESIILAYLHSFRPEPSLPGEAILYSTTEDGSTIKVKITLKNDGSIQIDAPTNVVINAQNATVTATAKMLIDSPDIELGASSVEKILNGETFQTFFNQHTHIGNLGYPTGAPNVLSDPSHLSETVKAKK